MKYDDCNRCYGLNHLLLCGRCEAWLCPRCLELHSCEAFCEQQESLHRMVRNLRKGAADGDGK